jgi:hypothetical protein
MAYLIAFDGTCDRCRTKRATVRVYNARNAPLGDFCRTCGERFAKEISAQEAKQTTTGA